MKSHLLEIPLINSFSSLSALNLLYEDDWGRVRFHWDQVLSDINRCLYYRRFRQESSLRSKRFRKVWEQRKTEERGFRYFACAENGAGAKKRTVGVGEGKEGTFLPSPPFIAL